MEQEEHTIRIPRITFKFRLPYGQSYQLTRMQFPLRLAYAMTFNKSQSQLYKRYFWISLSLHSVMGNYMLHLAGYETVK